MLVSGMDMMHKVFVTRGKDFDKRPQVFTFLKVGQGKGKLFIAWKSCFVSLKSQLGAKISVTKYDESIGLLSTQKGVI